ncbi:restriction endonuclease subunit S [Helicobacter bilis]|uniref:restriction endonuclease subunit S n=2 Tax=Helicobacter bilis TaxID=37372 RepID=UPI002557D06B|nr:restriction endonuclease subunit S [Helicobacter bilis]
MQWREFVVGEIFEVKATKNGIDKNKLSGKKGKIPYITRTENQNGVDDFIAEQENYLKNERNVIIIGLDTQTAFYHNSEFYTGQNIQILKNANLNQYNALFMIQALRNLMTKFNWGGNGATLTRLKRGKILLPIDSKGNPNYAFMESFMKNLEQKHLRKIIKYYENKLLDSNGGGVIFATHLILLNLHFAIPILYPAILIFYRVIPIFCLVILSKAKYPKDITNNPTLLQQSKNLTTFLEGSLMEIAKNELSLESVQWGEFIVGEIFKITNSKPYHKNNLQVGKGKTPYITRTSFNNGLEDIVENENFSLNPKDTISLGAENADFFYQGIEYITGNKMYYLSNERINRYTGLFIAQVLQKSIESCGFGYGKGLTGTRLHNRKIMLPTDSKGNPHYEFMESFMKNLEQKHLQKILAYYTHKLDSSGGGGNTL